MGLGIGGVSSCGCSDPPVNQPDPGKFRVVHCVPFGSAVFVAVQYEDATNYEGMKYLVYKDTTCRVISRAGRLDPHFCEGDHLSPFARFEPTPAGEHAARTLAMILGKGEHR